MYTCPHTCLHTCLHTLHLWQAETEEERNRWVKWIRDAGEASLVSGKAKDLHRQTSGTSKTALDLD